MDHRAEPHAHQDVGGYFLEGGHSLLPCVPHPLSPCQLGRLNVYTAGRKDELLNMLLHVQPLQECTARHGKRQPYHHIENGHLSPKDAHQQHQTAQVHHRRGDQKGKGDAQGQPRAGKTDEQRDGRAGAEGRHRPQQGGHQIGAHAVEPAQNVLAPLRWEIALYIGNRKNQNTEQYCNFQAVIQEKLYTAAEPSMDIQAQRGQAASEPLVQPPHAQNLLLKQAP